jgi:hypothetical protein
MHLESEGTEEMINARTLGDVAEPVLAVFLVLLDLRAVKVAVHCVRPCVCGGEARGGGASVSRLATIATFSTPTPIISHPLTAPPHAHNTTPTHPHLTSIHPPTHRRADARTGRPCACSRGSGRRGPTPPMPAPGRMCPSSVTRCSPVGFVCVCLVFRAIYIYIHIYMCVRV